jgi:hypothetical protein
MGLSGMQSKGVGPLSKTPLIQIAFAGHNRPGDLGDHKPLIRDLDIAFSMLKAAGLTNARLVTGLATGADELAAEAWRKAGMGSAHAIYPFLDEVPEQGIGPDALIQSATWLDGKAVEAVGRNPHLQQTRWLLGAADFLVVVWTGAQARGAGGTADAVRLALDRGVPVMWIKPQDHGQIRLIRPARPEQDFDFTEFLEGLEEGYDTHLEAATPQGVRALLGLGTLGLEGAPEPPDPLAPIPPSRLDDWLHTWLWKTYSGFRRWVGGRPQGGGRSVELPADLAEQPGFRVITEAYEVADRRANRLSAVHRSQQILLLFGMVTAAVVGSSPSLWPELKIAAVSTELALALFALVVWQGAARSQRHELWSETRRLAEQLRLERAGWAAGVSLVGSRAAPGDHNHSREILRRAGLPGGRFDDARVRTWGEWALSELIGGQAAYHRSIAARDGRVAHRIHMVEDVAFMLLLIILAGFLTLYFAQHGMGFHLPHWVAGAVMMASTIIPAVGAATLALEAKLEFSEQSDRSDHIARRLEGLIARLGPAPPLDDMQSAARLAMQWQIEEANQWREGASRRRLFRP